MKFLRSTLKYLMFFTLGIVTCAFVGLAVITYYTVDYLIQNPATTTSVQKKPYPVAKATLTPDLKTADQAPAQELIPASSKENFRKAFDTSRSFVMMSAEIGDLVRKLEKANMPPLCPSLCDASHMDREQLKENKVAYLEKYYQQQGTRALQDPEFRLITDDISRIHRLMVPAHKIMSKIDRLKERQQNPDGVSTTDKLVITAEIQGAVLSDFYGFVHDVEALKSEDKKMKLIRDLRKSCHKGKPVKQIISECDSVMSQQ
ncbi:hypothetical protein Bb109J_c0622 [Bdellovibrio bacteriovorus]|uniref:hypothetical protein n=1 Tax=Bdellovibrio bacteriovorus TaxID=959 RepID=UPI00045C01E5|nr:hypothetical protein [Bdellovibrio bacteriovorus]AHZ86762.1 hypothetical protein EP01_17740 [Bdellovibrio bacteriovorus]BEV67202.1 hypothetical protein Bb109J_c0622 [Bdellovibrio bacteriovorus]